MQSVTMQQQAKLEKLVREVVKEQGLEDGEISFRFATKPGDGYMGVMKGAEVKGANKELSLILKTAPSDRKLRQTNPIREAFLQEILFYEKIWPRFRRFQEESGIADAFTSVPKSYKTDDTPYSEVIIMENLLKQDFQLFDRQRKFGEKQMELVFREYAKFHGISYALRATSPEIYADLTSQLLRTVELFCEKTKMFQVLTDLAMQLLDVFDPETEAGYRDKFLRFAKNIKAEIYDCINARDNAVIVHGDCWCNNMMFKFDKSIIVDCPVEMRLLDFQILREASPVLDLAYCFYTSACPAAMDNYQRYLKIYHDALSGYLAQYNIDVDDHLSMQTLQAHWRKIAKYGLIMGLMILKTQVTEDDEVPDFNKAAGEDIDILEELVFVRKNEEEYRRRIKGIIKHFCDNGLI